ncbi:MAG: pilus assembly protein [Lachnospiraceae bacterium]|nr:pilus assembly protein [Lachnospiraceae bacterium]
MKKYIFDKKNKKNGSMTIELSLLMPVILGVLIFIIFLGFYLHDRCILTKACYYAAMKGSEQTDDDNAYIVSEEALNEVINNRLIGKWESRESIYVDEEKITVSLEAGITFNNSLFFGLLDDNRMGLKRSAVAYRINETDYMRKKRREGNRD